MLIHCMDQIQAAQERIPSHLGSAQNVAPTIDFSLAETKELLQATLVIPPDPAMNWGEQTIELCNRCRLMHHGPPARTATTMQGFLCKCDLDHTLDASSGEYANVRVAPANTSKHLLIAEVMVVAIGAALLACAFAADQQWFDKHFLPAFFVSRSKYILVYQRARFAIAAAGAITLLLRRPIEGVIARNRSRVLHVTISIVLAFCAAELVLRRTQLRAAEEVPAAMEPRRRLDPRLGWVFVPSRVGYQTRNGQIVDYAFDRNGYRVRRVDDVVDHECPTIVFTGESIMVGERLHWEETMPAQTGKILGMQSANLAVSGFASDQAYMR